MLKSFLYLKWNVNSEQCERVHLLWESAMSINDKINIQQISIVNIFSLINITSYESSHLIFMAVLVLILIRNGNCWWWIFVVILRENGNCVVISKSGKSWRICWSGIALQSLLINLTWEFLLIISYLLFLKNNSKLAWHDIKEVQQRSKKSISLLTTDTTNPVKWQMNKDKIVIENFCN